MVGPINIPKLENWTNTAKQNKHFTKKNVLSQTHVISISVIANT